LLIIALNIFQNTIGILRLTLWFKKQKMKNRFNTHRKNIKKNFAKKIIMLQLKQYEASIYTRDAVDTDLDGYPAGRIFG
jgi:hypothetical protein